MRPSHSLVLLASVVLLSFLSASCNSAGNTLNYQQKIAGLEEQLSTQSQRVADLSEKLASLEGKVGNEASVDKSTGRMIAASGMELTIKGLNSTVNKLEGRVKDIEGELGAGLLTYNYGYIMNSRIDMLQDRLASLELDTKLNIPGLDSEVRMLWDELSSANTVKPVFPSLATAGAGMKNSRLDELESELGTVLGLVQALQNKAKQLSDEVEPDMHKDTFGRMILSRVDLLEDKLTNSQARVQHLEGELSLVYFPGIPFSRSRIDSLEDRIDGLERTLPTPTPLWRR